MDLSSLPPKLIPVVRINYREYYIGDGSTTVLVDFATQVVEDLAQVLGFRFFPWNDEQSNEVDFFLGPFGSDLTNMIAPIIERRGQLMISSATTSSTNFICPKEHLESYPPCKFPGTTRFQNSFGIASSATNAFFTSAQALLLFPDGIRFATIQEDRDWLREVNLGAASIFSQAGREWVCDVTVSSMQFPFSRGSFLIYVSVPFRRGDAFGCFNYRAEEGRCHLPCHLSTRLH